MKKVTVTYRIPDDWDTESFAMELFDEWCYAHESEWDTDEHGEPICPIVARGWGDN
jgi:hypothetical protein